jgi:selenide,water dikinase
MRPIPGVGVTLISDCSVIPYSAMVPGYIAGEYRWDEVTIDLVRLCRWAQVRFLCDQVLGIDPASRHVTFGARPQLAYDVLSLGIGSMPSRPPGLTDNDFSLPMRPLTGLVQKLDDWQRELNMAERPFHLVIVGAGASVC